MRWERVELGSEVTLLSGGTPKKSVPAFWDGEIPWVSSGEMTQRRIWDTALHVTNEGAIKGTKLIPPKTVLVVVRGMSLAKEFRVSLTQREVTFNQDIKALKCSERLNPEFLYYYLLSQARSIRDSTTEASHGTKKLESVILQKWPLPVPSDHEQLAIVEVLSKYDDLIFNNKRRVEILEESARQLYKEWFVRFRFPGHEHVKIVDGVPEGWHRCQVGDLLTLQRGFDLPVKNRIEGTVPIYASTGINGYHNEYKVKAPGIVTGRSGSLGTVLYVSKDFWPLNTALWVKEFKKVTPYYALFFLQSLKLENYNGGAAVPTLNRNDVHRIETFSPPEKLLESLNDYLNPIFDQIDTLAQQNLKLSQARDLLLPNLMNGEIAV
ncbi:MAG: hypothetical protein CME59_04665 [Halioglobus sp.]|nr:hypothetical protein [Halioglobus sp.]